jgi:hypothetical protein
MSYINQQDKVALSYLKSYDLPVVGKADSKLQELKN